MHFLNLGVKRLTRLAGLGGWRDEKSGHNSEAAVVRDSTVYLLHQAQEPQVNHPFVFPQQIDVRPTLEMLRNAGIKV